ncbi:hypothetical protein ABW21_db0202736 [Orbilia brochopaga]|nr:hypothetical protein ABW21_db0202736 [Drechslerella brochopaga]
MWVLVVLDILQFRKLLSSLVVQYLSHGPVPDFNSPSFIFFSLVLSILIAVRYTFINSSIMRYSTLISTYLLLLLPTAFAAPTASPSNNAIAKPASSSHRRVRRGPPTAPLSEDPEGNYIVIMAANETRSWPDIFEEMGFDTTDPTLRATEAPEYDYGKQVGHVRTFGLSMRAFTMRMRNSEADSMNGADNVAIIEPNSVVDIPAIVASEPANMTVASFEFQGPLTKRQQGQVAQQQNAPWNIARISTPNRVNVGGRRVGGLGFNYQFDNTAGSGVDVYMLDTGMNTAHSDFGGRAKTVFSAFRDDGRDNEGHGYV